jgi:hypothetical protein
VFGDALVLSQKLIDLFNHSDIQEKPKKSKSWVAVNAAKNQNPISINFFLSFDKARFEIQILN